MVEGTHEVQSNTTSFQRCEKYNMICRLCELANNGLASTLSHSTIETKISANIGKVSADPGGRRAIEHSRETISVESSLQEIEETGELGKSQRFERDRNKGTDFNSPARIRQL